MFKQNRNLMIIALIAIVNALGYGIIIPILYSYSHKFGLTDFQNGLLFAVFSICQFISTPIIGRLSDKYGRKPLLVASISGTVLSFLIMAFAPSAIWLFLARALDGITAGNIPVASAVITDTTEPKDRAKGFGIIGASFGFGFIIGPAISAATVGINATYPFLIAAGVSFVAVLMTWFFLPETNKHMGETKHDSLFNFKKLFKSLQSPTIGVTLLVTLFFSIAMSMNIYAFQSVAVQVLKMNANQISWVFMLFGSIGLITQVFLIQRIKKYLGIKKTFQFSLIIISIIFFALAFVKTIPQFIIANVIMGLVNSFVQPLSQTILSEEVDMKEQGEMLGINSSYMSIGQIIGPILAGGIATFQVQLPFAGAAFFVFICYILSFTIFQHLSAKQVIV